MTKWMGSRFRSRGVSGESIVTVKPPWVKYLSLWAVQRQLFCKSSLPGDSVATGQRKLDDVPDTAVSLWSDTSQCLCWVFFSHVWISDSYQEAVLQKWRSQLWKAPAPTLCGCGASSLPKAVPLATAFQGKGHCHRHQGTAVPVPWSPFMGLPKPLKNKAQHFIGKWSPT